MLMHSLRAIFALTEESFSVPKELFTKSTVTYARAPA